MPRPTSKLQMLIAHGETPTQQTWTALSSVPVGRVPSSLACGPKGIFPLYGTPCRPLSVRSPPHLPFPSHITATRRGKGKKEETERPVVGGVSISKGRWVSSRQKRKRSLSSFAVLPLLRCQRGQPAADPFPIGLRQESLIVEALPHLLPLKLRQRQRQKQRQRQLGISMLSIDNWKTWPRDLAPIVPVVPFGSTHSSSVAAQQLPALPSTAVAFFMLPAHPCRRQN
ncbi:hypothetical protein CH63R_03102 [Colletotrichum higginsianum IMI 349063]|uniref:Uncharacterized protein n=1 Tax=Colletotrichum higginsianum (strain IMI 349063) TaxID=759273 RepID=A0A1B7YQQ5_COLHI|nr:hypothetical protein CH63R_03102 [Colletotrichum higginsianum IMI 349063]OBR14376.1 hypothetical protein CH63R_03102 [Colletotrichum higginsianum IMI 349063]